MIDIQASRNILDEIRIKATLRRSHYLRTKRWRKQNGGHENQYKMAKQDGG